MPAGRSRRRSRAIEGGCRRITDAPVDFDVAADAMARHTGLSETVLSALVATAREAGAREWLRRNAEAIEAYNERIERGGVLNRGLLVTHD